MTVGIYVKISFLVDMKILSSTVLLRIKKNSFCFQKQVLKSNFEYLSYVAFHDSTIRMLHVHCCFCVSYSLAQ